MVRGFAVPRVRACGPALLALALALALALSPPLASAQTREAGRGQLLYDTACTECHAQSVHSRKTRVARSLDEVRGYVQRWSRTIGLNWSEQDILDVTLYLNRQHYHFPCDGSGCKREAASLRTPAAPLAQHDAQGALSR